MTHVLMCFMVDNFHLGKYCVLFQNVDLTLTKSEDTAVYLDIWCQLLSSSMTEEQETCFLQSVHNVSHLKWCHLFFQTRHSLSKTYNRYPHCPMDFLPLQWSKMIFPHMYAYLHIVVMFMLSFIEIHWMVWEEMHLQGLWTDGGTDRQTCVIDS